MEYRKTKNFPEDVSVIGFGAWSLASYNWTCGNISVAEKAVEAAFEGGTNFFDVAPVYGYGNSERVLGRVLKNKRDEVIIATKCGLRWDERDGPTRNDLSRESILWEVDQSLSRLDTDYIDLYQMHWPDPDTPIEETMDTMKELVKAGKIRYIGLSNFSVEDMKKANEIAPIATHQGLYNLVDRNSEAYCDIPLEYRTEKEILPFCRENGIGFLPYSPLSQGLLSGRYYKDRDQDLIESDVRLTNPELVGKALNSKLDQVEELRKLGEDTDYTLTELSIGWLLSRPEVTTVLVGSREPRYARENAAMGDIKLSQDIIDRIENIFSE